VTQTLIQKSFRPFKAYLPGFIWKPIRCACTALLTPALFSYRTGHFLSSLKMAPVSRKGEPIPWYTYPCIDFLRCRTFDEKIIVEFGGGHSTLWWSQRAKHVITFEGDKAWFEHLQKKLSSNVSLFLVSMEDRLACVKQIHNLLATLPYERYDVLIIDGLYRYEMIDIACQYVSNQGVIICDDAEGYGFHEGFVERDFCRADFFGHAPGVVLPRCTSLFFRPNAFVFDRHYPIPVIAQI
jgi:hypothetical protein